MADDWQQLFSEFPILQASIICKDITTNMEGQRTFHNEIYSIPKEGLNQFILVQLWRGNNTTEDTFYEIVELIDPDGNIISSTKTPEFPLIGSSNRHYNLYSYHSFVFPKTGTYEIRSKLYKNNLASINNNHVIYENFFVVI